MSKPTTEAKASSDLSGQYESGLAVMDSIKSLSQYVQHHPDAKGGLKYDTGKPDLTYVSYELMEAVARVREFGAKKYSRDNWKKGFKVTRSLAASLRHIFLFLAGETLDPESGQSHLAHAVCGLEHAIYDLKHRPENDDREVK
jgi:hypothetical protein